MRLLAPFKSLFQGMGAVWVILLQEGKAVCVKGTVGSQALRDVETISCDLETNKGLIIKTGNGHLKFSSNIPASSHQSLRNVLADT